MKKLAREDDAFLSADWLHDATGIIYMIGRIVNFVRLIILEGKQVTQEASILNRNCAESFATSIS